MSLNDMIMYYIILDYVIINIYIVNANVIFIYPFIHFITYIILCLCQCMCSHAYYHNTTRSDSSGAHHLAFLWDHQLSCRWNTRKTMETTEHPVVPHCFYDGKTMKIPDKFRVSWWKNHGHKLLWWFLPTCLWV